MVRAWWFGFHRTWQCQPADSGAYDHMLTPVRESGEDKAYARC